MDFKRPIRSARMTLLSFLVCLGVLGNCHAAIREYAFISIKIGTAASTPANTGTLVFELWPDLAPKTVQNFKHLANTGFYDGTASHRLIKDFMVQAGDPLTRSATNVKSFGSGGPGYTIPDEVAKPTDQTWEKRKHVRGVLSMAHSNNPDNNVFNTGGSQFFAMFGTAEHLDGVHTTFGTMTSGFEFLQSLENSQTSSRQTTIFDLNNTAVFEDFEKEIILQTFNGTQEQWGPTWKTLFNKPADQEFTQEELTFIANAVGGFTDIDQNGELTNAELNDPKNGAPLKIDQPIERIGIQSVRVFAINDAIQDSVTVPFSYESTTHSGLLRPSDRSQIVGRYNVSVQRSGAFSAAVEYLARKISFSGKFVASNEILPESGMPKRVSRMEQLTVVSDSGSNFPLLVELRMHHAFSSGTLKNAIGVTLASLGPSDVITPLARGFSESLSPPVRNSLSTKYTVLAQPNRSSRFNPPAEWLPDNTSVTGNSHFSIQVTPSLGISYVLGRLADGVPFAASRMINSEHGATISPIYTCTFPSGIESLRGTFPAYDMAALYEITYRYARSLAFGAAPLSDKSSTSAALGDLIWIHPETTFAGAPLKNRLVVNNVTATAPWTAPALGAVMKPFSTTTTAPTGQLFINGTPLNFTVSNNNIIATFQQPQGALNPFLRFDPRTGEFSGYFFEPTPSPKRRVFSGVLMNSTNATGGFGYYLDANSSKSIRIIPTP
jgi:peptidyl-prolyl cis-trans isomerase B (cyclophilin B)